MTVYEFWQRAYLEALHAGKAPTFANDIANQAVAHYNLYLESRYSTNKKG